MAQFDIRRVAVIGTGPCGLSAAKYLISQKTFEEVLIYEQQTEVGGVWNYNPKPSPTQHVPQVSGFASTDPPVQIAPSVQSTPMYDVLHTNIPGPLMKYSDLNFSRTSTIFPSRESVQRYLVKYSYDIREHIRFQNRVVDVRLGVKGGRDRWHLSIRSTKDGCGHCRTFDAVVVASGHYSTMYIPDVKNIKDFNDAHPGIITHSKSYRSARDFKGKKVIVVGNAASGLDIASQISRVCKKPLLLSVHTPTPADNLEWADAEEVPVIEEFLVEERAVRFQDGRVERDVDAILYATGYLFTFPFLKSLKPRLLTDGRRVHGLYKDLFHIEHPSLAFPGLPIKVVPFPLSESQAAIFSRVWANVLPLPDKEAMYQWEEEEARRRGASFHVWPKGGDAEFINETHAMLANTPGKEPPLWTEELLWQRKIYAEAKLAFEKSGCTAKSLEELGFHYRPSPQASEQEIL
jgi:cation diffusion facilitator CzcD-associated flavoprotein CzcO